MPSLIACSMTASATVTAGLRGDGILASVITCTATLTASPFSDISCVMICAATLTGGLQSFGYPFSYGYGRGSPFYYGYRGESD